MPKNKDNNTSSEKDPKSEPENQDGTEDEEEETTHTLTIFSENLEQKVWDIAGKLWKKSNKVREKPPVDWVPYLENGFISQKEFSFINAFQYTKTKEERDMLIEYYKDLSFKAIVKVTQRISVVEEIEKFLVLVNDLLAEDISITEKFYKAIDEPWMSFTHLLSCSDDFMQNMGSRIITKLMVGHKKKRPPPDKIEFFLEWLREELREENEYLLSVARCLQRILQVDEYRLAFMNLSGVYQILKLLARGINPQAQYQFCFCLWVTTFNSHLADKLNQSALIPILMDLLERCPTEITKLPRVVIATFRNLLEKPNDVRVRRSNALMMIQCKLLQSMDFFETRTDLSNDPEYLEDFQLVKDILNACVTELTSFDEYNLELKSARLKWSVVHTSKRFWVENAERFNDNKYELLKILINILQNCKDTTAICIAAHDIGEYVKHYPRGKIVIEQLGGKDALVDLLSHKHPAVKFHALKSLQVVMLENPEVYASSEDPSKKIKKKTEKIGFGL
ncbi:V-type proton ATPase subunit H-like [Argiope bruennichi]|uniref:V-type proton ATPase subunit H n=1 Tax=Argiope bruennichi TaxID=94029 RepID=A0A8T0EZS0_ARGBR|nr:V-type proton ATPase subunit H-like [Argiope bruennichi]KAF8782138.1 V-type proton ATPase subunit H like protein [Argiope bruennichi]